MFSGPMVRALLAGGKTQTRRILKCDVPPAPALDNVKREPKHEAPYLDAYCGERKTAANPRGKGPLWAWWTRDDRPGALFRVGYVPGDVLWVRETWQGLTFGDYLTTATPPCDLRYKATDPLAALAADVRGYAWRPAIHMPRWASRLTLVVVDVRVERLKSISREDAIAEGVNAISLADLPRQAAWNEAHDFAQIWDRIHGPGAWDRNPWVVALTFTAHAGNVEEFLQQRSAA